MTENHLCLYLLVSGSCNLTCSYCYADGGGFGRPAQCMTSETMQMSLRKLMPRNGHLLLSFFGGEPLMNFELIRQAVDFSRVLGKEYGTTVRYVLTTNGKLLNADHVEYFRQHFSHIGVSLDGDASITNHGRKFKDESGDVYARVVENLGRLRAAGVRYALRGTITEDRAHETEFAIRHLANLGAADWRVEPAFGPTPWKRDNWRALMEGMCRFYAGTRKAFLAGEKLLMAGELYRAAAYRLHGMQRRYPCAASKGMLAVSTEGNVYPCNEFVAVEAACMGNVHQDEFPNERFNRIVKRLEENTVDARPKCSHCSVRYICGGECPVHCLLRSGDIAEPSPEHCALKARTAKENIRFLEEVLVDASGRTKIENFLSGKL